MAASYSLVWFGFPTLLKLVYNFTSVVPKGVPSTFAQNIPHRSENKSDSGIDEPKSWIATNCGKRFEALLDWPLVDKVICHQLPHY